MEYKIEKMQDTEGGFQVATVRSFYDQREYTLHNRFGSWFIGDPTDRHATMRAPETISPSLPFDLQDYKNGNKGRNVEAAPMKENVFMKRATAKTNLFIAKAAVRENPFIKKAATKSNPFMTKKA